MATIPTNPSDGDTFTDGVGVTWTYNSSSNKWLIPVSSGGGTTISGAVQGFWQPVDLGSVYLAVQINEIVISGSTWIIAAASGIVFRSTDSGATWTRYQHSTFEINNGLATDGSGNWVICCNAGQILQSSNDGVSWTQRTTGAPTTSAGNFYSVATDGTTWIAVGTNNLIYKSTNGGVTWSAGTNPATNNEIRTFYTINYADGTWIISGTSGDVYRSTNSGSSWTQPTTSVSATIYAGTTDGSGNWFLGGTSGNIKVSEDDGITWSERYTGLSNFYSATTDGTTLIFGELGGGLVISNDLGKTVATRPTSGYTSTIYAITTDGTDWLLGASQGYVARAQ